jgi:hypothetical protein
MAAIRSPYRRSEWYIGMRFDPVRDNIVSTRDEDRHNELRAKMAAGVSSLIQFIPTMSYYLSQYSGKENKKLEETIDRNIEALINLIRQKYLSTDSENKPLDFGRKAQYLTLDVISDVAYREPFGFIETDSDLYDYNKIVESVFVAAVMVTVFPWINWVLGLRIMKAALPSDKDVLGIGKITGYFLPL